MSDENTLKTWLAEKLAAKGWTVDDLAHASGLHRSTVYHYYTDRSRPSRRTIERICAALGVDVDEAIVHFTPRRVGRPL